MIILLVKYTCKPGRRADFMRVISENQIDAKSRDEAGNIQYEYSLDIEDKDVLILTELWKDEEALKLHGEAAHFKLLGQIKDEYVEETQIRRFKAEKMKYQ